MMSGESADEGELVIGMKPTQSNGELIPENNILAKLQTETI